MTAATSGRPHTALARAVGRWSVPSAAAQISTGPAQVEAEVQTKEAGAKPEQAEGLDGK